MTQKGKVLIACKAHPILAEGLVLQGFEVEYLPKTDYLQGLMAIKGCVGLITANNMRVDKVMIDAAPFLQFIGRMGSGMEIIDTDYAQLRNIRCFGSPDGNCNAVAEHALGMLLSLNKNICKSYDEVLNGQWLREENRGVELEGKTIGIIGYGHTGSAFARLLSSFRMNILVYDKYKIVAPANHIVVCDTLAPIFQKSDIISVHVPLSKDTHHLINDSFIQKVQNPFLLLNTSRGSVVQTSILFKYLKDKKLLGVALDVWEEEPLDKMTAESRKIFEELSQCQNVLITPHIAGYSHEALYKMGISLLKQIIA